MGKHTFNHVFGNTKYTLLFIYKRSFRPFPVFVKTESGWTTLCLDPFCTFVSNAEIFDISMFLSAGYENRARR